MRVRNTVLRIEQSGVFLCGERLHAEGGAVGQFCGGNFLVFHNRYWKSDFSNSPGRGVGKGAGDYGFANFVNNFCPTLSGI